MEKSASAFRTISEVADVLETPAHVLRFWESRFPQIKPVKRAGGRRYYRPGDVALLAGIKRLLHDEGMTIRGVQKILREQGVRHVSGMSETESEAAEALQAAFPPEVPEFGDDMPEAQVVSLSDWVGAAETAEPDVAVPVIPAPDMPAPDMPAPEPVTAEAPPPASPIAPVITDDEIVEEDAFRSALDWAKSLTETETRVARPADAILQLTERVASETIRIVETTPVDSVEDLFAAEVYSAADDEGRDDYLDDDALTPGAAIDSLVPDSGDTEAAAIAALESHPAPQAPLEPTESVPVAADDAAMAAAPVLDDVTDIDAAPVLDAAPDIDDAGIWLPTHLRRHSAADLAAQAPALRALHARLTALHARVADAARSSRM